MQRGKGAKTQLRQQTDRQTEREGEREEVTVLLLKSDSRADRLERIETQGCSFKLFHSPPGQRPLSHVTSQPECVPNQTLSSLPVVGFPKILRLWSVEFGDYLAD